MTEYLDLSGTFYHVAFDTRSQRVQVSKRGSIHLDNLEEVEQLIQRLEVAVREIRNYHNKDHLTPTAKPLSNTEVQKRWWESEQARKHEAAEATKEQLQLHKHKWEV